MDIVKIGQMTNSNVYIGDNQLIGRFKEITPPEIEYGLTKHETLGSIGELEKANRSLKSLKGKGVFDFIDADLVPSFYDPRAAIPLMIESFVDVFDSNGLNVGQGHRLITHITLTVFKSGTKAFKLGENLEGEFEYTATRFVQKFSHKETIFREIDMAAQINNLNGKPVWPTY